MRLLRVSGDFRILGNTEPLRVIRGGAIFYLEEGQVLHANDSVILTPYQQITLLQLDTGEVSAFAGGDAFFSQMGSGTDLLGQRDLDGSLLDESSFGRGLFEFSNRGGFFNDFGYDFSYGGGPFDGSHFNSYFFSNEVGFHGFEFGVRMTESLA